MSAETLITCPNCAARYAVPAGMLGAGRSLRCATCATTWFAAPQAEPEPEAETQRLMAAWEEDARREAEEAERASAAGTAAFEADGNDPGSEGARIERPRSRRPSDEQRSARWLAAFLVGCCVALLIVAMKERESVVRREPDLAGVFAMLGLPVNLAGLEFRDVVSRTDYEKGLPVLMVEAAIVNIGSGSVAIPPVALTARDAAGAPLHTWTIKGAKERAEAGELVPLQATLASPPSNAHDVMLRFSGRDARSGRAR